jgi:3'-phosphoadenosine 5'-phosphosulfate sulfotransferase (PAPS reductase)/FAD synthetase
VYDTPMQLKLPFTQHIVALSGGKDSSAMALKLRELNPDTPYQFVCTPTGDELPEMVDHMKQLERLLGQKIRSLTVEHTLYSLIEEWNCIPNWRMRWCTRVLKIEPFQEFLRQNTPAIVYVGLRADEEIREGVDWQTEGITNCFPMRDWGWGIEDVELYLESRNVSIPKRTDCSICYYQTLFEWRELWRKYPDRFKKAMAVEESTGHTFRSESKDKHPHRLKDLKKLFEEGWVPRTRKTKRSVMCSHCAR